MKCVYKKMVPVEDLKPNPKNPNVHSDAQINRLCEIIKYQGFRNPIIVSNFTGFVVCGHGRIKAAKKLGIKEVPVDFQEFDNQDQEYAHMIADNAIAEWSDLDLARINFDLKDLGPDLNIDMLGLKDFEIEFMDVVKEKKNKEEICPKCGFVL